MKVLNAMSTRVDHTTPKSKVRDVSKLIFGHHINGLPVVEGKKVVGFVTEKDILAQFFPSMKEYMEDPVNETNFEKMEKKIAAIFEMPVDKIMSKKPVTVTPETPLLKAQSLMFIKKVGRLPVVDKNKNIVGIISKGDIFKFLVGKRIK
jgi:CBS domain-containing protein